MKKINITAPRGKILSCKGWIQEAALRMLMNNLDPQVAENPDELIVYGGRGKAARNWECYETIVSALKKLENDETLLVQSGKAIGVLRTHLDAPRVLLANSNLVGRWANWECFDKLERAGLMMYGQMTAGSWIYIGSQGILQGTYETFAQAARTHFNNDGNLRKKIVLTAGLGGMGGAQPLAVKMCGGVCLAVEVDKSRILKRIETGYLDEWTSDIDEALKMCAAARDSVRAHTVGLLGNASEVFEQLYARGFVPDLVTDQTSAHDPMIGYVPKHMSQSERISMRENHPKAYLERVRESMVDQVTTMLKWHDSGVPVFDYGNNLRAEAKIGGLARAFDYPGFVPAYIRPLFCLGMGPFRWVALSGDPEDIAVTDQALRTLFPENHGLQRWLTMAEKLVSFQGLPARICWLGLGERHQAGLLFNELVRSGRVKAPIVIGRDHLDSGSVASPNRETEAMKDGSDAVADWPILNALVNAVSGASWVSVHQGGGVGMGYSLHAGQVIVADGTKEAAQRIARVLWADPAMGIFRHADAGYDEAIACAKSNHVQIPGLT